jgi:effector-binding domain-containing protein
LSDAWGELQAWVREQKLPETGRFFERYLNDTDEVQDQLQYRTELNWILSEA